jgi:hypothetical protein
MAQNFIDFGTNPPPGVAPATSSQRNAFREAIYAAAKWALGEKADLVHTHVIDDVAGLQQALDLAMQSGGIGADDTASATWPITDETTLELRAKNPGPDGAGFQLRTVVDMVEDRLGLRVSSQRRINVAGNVSFYGLPVTFPELVQFGEIGGRALYNTTGIYRDEDFMLVWDPAMNNGQGLWAFRIRVLREGQMREAIWISYDPAIDPTQAVGWAVWDGGAPVLPQGIPTFGPVAGGKVVTLTSGDLRRVRVAGSFEDFHNGQTFEIPDLLTAPSSDPDQPIWKASDATRNYAMLAMGPGTPYELQVQEKDDPEGDRIIFFVSLNSPATPDLISGWEPSPHGTPVTTMLPATIGQAASLLNASAETPITITLSGDADAPLVGGISPALSGGAAWTTTFVSTLPQILSELQQAQARKNIGVPDPPAEQQATAVIPMGANAAIRVTAKLAGSSGNGIVVRTTYGPPAVSHLFEVDLDNPRDVEIRGGPDHRFHANLGTRTDVQPYNGPVSFAGTIGSYWVWTSSGGLTDIRRTSVFVNDRTTPVTLVALIPNVMCQVMVLLGGQTENQAYYLSTKIGGGAWPSDFAFPFPSRFPGGSGMGHFAPVVTRQILAANDVVQLINQTNLLLFDARNVSGSTGGGPMITTAPTVLTGGTTGTEAFVSTLPQTFTGEQQAQARLNIGVEPDIAPARGVLDMGTNAVLGFEAKEKGTAGNDLSVSCAVNPALGTPTTLGFNNNLLSIVSAGWRALRWRIVNPGGLLREEVVLEYDVAGNAGDPDWHAWYGMSLVRYDGLTIGQPSIPGWRYAVSAQQDGMGNPIWEVVTGPMTDTGPILQYAWTDPNVPNRLIVTITTDPGVSSTVELVRVSDDLNGFPVWEQGSDWAMFWQDGEWRLVDESGTYVAAVTSDAPTPVGLSFGEPTIGLGIPTVAGADYFVGSYGLQRAQSSDGGMWEWTGSDWEPEGSGIDDFVWTLPRTNNAPQGTLPGTSDTLTPLAEQASTIMALVNANANLPLFAQHAPGSNGSGRVIVAGPIQLSGGGIASIDAVSTLPQFLSAQQKRQARNNIGAVEGVGISRIMRITQAEYDNLSEVDPETYYVIIA